MEFKLQKGRIVKKLSLSLFIVLVVSYLFSALSIVNNRISYSLAGSTWLSLDKGFVTFDQENLTGFYVNEESIKTSFKYEAARGYVICKSDSNLIFEFAQLKDNRLFAINRNTMFYNSEFLT